MTSYATILRRTALAWLCLTAVSLACGAGAKTALPRLVDLGAGKCIPCKMMKPILDEFMKDYSDQFETVFIDVWENKDAGTPYKIRLIPTQIFYDTTGKELFRHEGFYSKKDILAKWKELGVTIREPAGSKR